MKKLITLAAVLCTLNFAPMAYADAASAPSGSLEHALSKLPQEKADNFRDSMQEAHDKNQDLYAQVKDIHKQMDAILTADTFDSDAFTAQSEKLRQVHEQIATNLDVAFVQAVSDLSASERKLLVHALEHAHKAKQAAKADQ